jgi:hypothetical protein
MEPQADAIVDIAESQVRYFGGPGKMLLPSPATVAALIQKVPKHKLLLLLCHFGFRDVYYRA